MGVWLQKWIMTEPLRGICIKKTDRLTPTSTYGSMTSQAQQQVIKNQLSQPLCTAATLAEV